jgi:hypothetical protein
VAVKDLTDSHLLISTDFPGAREIVSPLDIAAWTSQSESFLSSIILSGWHDDIAVMTATMTTNFLMAGLLPVYFKYIQLYLNIHKNQVTIQSPAGDSVGSSLPQSAE